MGRRRARGYCSCCYCLIVSLVDAVSDKKVPTIGERKPLDRLLAGSLLASSGEIDETKTCLEKPPVRPQIDESRRELIVSPLPDVIHDLMMATNRRRREAASRFKVMRTSSITRSTHRHARSRRRAPATTSSSTADAHAEGVQAAAVATAATAATVEVCKKRAARR